MFRPKNFNRVVVEGIDGSGKSTAAFGAAELLSSTYRDIDIRVADSDGVTFYRGGEIINNKLASVERLIASGKVSKIGSAVRSLAFMGARQYSEQFAGHGPDRLVIGVRDPFRVDPAAYSPVLLHERFADISAEKRLKLFSGLTWAAHPKTIAILTVDSAEAYGKAVVRGETDYHETPEKVAIVARELPKVLQAYQDWKGVDIAHVQALTPGTSDQIAAVFEPFLPN